MKRLLEAGIARQWRLTHRRRHPRPLLATDHSIAAQAERARRRQRRMRRAWLILLVASLGSLAVRVSVRWNDIAEALGEERRTNVLLADSLQMARAAIDARARAIVRLMPATVPDAQLPTAGRVTSGLSFSRQHPILQVLRSHEGIDIAAAEGTVVIAPASGVVTRVARTWDYGRVVEVDHGRGILTRYAHLQRASVHVGDDVRPGDSLGTVGHSGLATRSHLHYEIRFNGRPVDPRRFILATARVVPTPTLQ